jgi:hypothetical protein
MNSIALMLTLVGGACLACLLLVVFVFIAFGAMKFIRDKSNIAQLESNVAQLKTIDPSDGIDDRELKILKDLLVKQREAEEVTSAKETIAKAIAS